MAKIFGFHACEREFADKVRTGKLRIAGWLPSRNDYDWLGDGIYFWEGSLRRAQEWAAERIDGSAAIIEAEIELGACFDLISSEYLDLLPRVHANAVAAYKRLGLVLPTNEAGGGKLRRLDRLVITRFLKMMEEGRGLAPVKFQTVRCPFEEGEPVFPGSMIRRQTHIQVAVRDSSCIDVQKFHFL
jgi:hypothetical protein